jgi:hypothetical protein
VNEAGDVCRQVSMRNHAAQTPAKSSVTHSFARWLPKAP